MTPLHQLLVNFLFVCAHLIAILLWHFVFEVIVLVGGGGGAAGACLMIEADTCQAANLLSRMITVLQVEAKLVWL